MNIPKGKIELACAKPSALRPVLENPHLDVDKKRLVATNSYILVAIPVEVVEEDTSGVVPLGALAFAKKNRAKNIVCNGGIEIPGVGTLLRNGLEGKYPDVDKIISDHQANLSIGLNARYLYHAAQALGDDTLRVEISDPVKAIKITPMNIQSDAFGLIMPIRTHG